MVNVGLCTLAGKPNNTLNVKCPKKTNRWVSLGVLLNFLKQYRCTIV